MDFRSLYQKISELDSIKEEVDPVNGKTPEEAMKDPRYATDPAFKAEVDKAASIGTSPEAAPAEQQDLGDGFVLTSVDLAGQQNPAVLDTQSNTYILRNKRADGSAIFRTPAPYILVKDGKPETTMKVGPASAAALQKAGLMNESASDTFAALYKQIKSIDENADVEECGMMPIVAGQSDSVNMNVSLNASGGGGIRELMNVLKNIDDVAAPQHGDSDGHEDPMFGDSFEEEFGNSMAGHGGPTTAPVSAVLPTGDDMHSKGIEAKKVNGGGNPLARKSSMEESIVDQLQNLYTKIKNR